MIPEKAKLFFKNKNITGHDFQVMKWIAIAAIILSIILSAVIFRMAGRNRIVAVVDQLGQPHTAQVKDKKIHNVVNYKQFINEFLTTMWTWNKDTFPHQMKRLENLMTENCWNDLAIAINKENYIERIEEYKMTSSIIPPPSERISEAKPYFNEQGDRIGWYVEVEAVKISFSNIINKNQAEKHNVTFNTNKSVTPYKYKIAFKNTGLTSKNIWGLKVFKYEQNSVKKEGELLE